MATIAKQIGRTGNDQLLGTTGRDFLWGGDGNDQLEGGAERDVLYGGAGNDELKGGAGDDMLDGGTGRDKLYGEGGNDVLVGQGWLDGGPGNDMIVATGRSNVIGGAGQDTLISLGENNLSRLDYSGSDPNLGVTVNLATGRGQGGHAQGDTISGFNQIVGSRGNDILTGNDENNWFKDMGGKDEYYGGGGIDLISYHNSKIGVTVDLNAGTGSGGHANEDTFVSIESLWGSRGDDTFRGNDKDNYLGGGDGGDDVFEGRGGADTLDGGTGESDTASYESSPRSESGEGVTVNLGGPQDAKGYVIGHTGGHAEGDKLKGIDNLRGSAHADTLTGDGGDNILEGGAGGDALDGGAGDGDTASYADSNEEVTVNLGGSRDANGYVIGHTGGHAAGDKLKNIENLRGSAGKDTLTGDSGDNVLEGGAEADTLNGGGTEDSDTASYESSSGSESGEGVTVNLGGSRDANGYVIGHTGGHAAGDKLKNIENLRGSAHADTLTGDSEDNILEGGAGKDTLTGGTGADTFVFGQDSVVRSPTTDEELLAQTDTVTDFSQTQGDKLDFRGLKEHASLTGTKLIFLRTNAFSNSADQGQVRYQYISEKNATNVQVDLNGDGEADFQVTLDGENYALTVSDMLGVEVA